MAKRVGPYELESSLARGGMGEVWRARLHGLGGFSRTVALKQMHRSLTTDAGGTEAFLREARTGARLLHPNVASVLDVGIDGDRMYLAMELVDGVDLRRVMKRAALLNVPMPIPLCGFVVHQVLCALEAAHALRHDDGNPQPLVHRDISPENVLLGLWGDVRVVDFGLARTGDVGDQLTQVGVVKGKTSYMAPEQLEGGTVDPTWDVFAVGNLMHEILTGHKPYDANNPVHAMMLSRQKTPSASDVRPEVPRSLSDISVVMRAPFAKDRPTATRARGMLEQALRPLLQGIPSAQLADYLGFLMRNTAAGATAPPVGGPCAKCGGTLLGEWSGGSMVLDRCADCGGVWLDAHEVDRVVGERVVSSGREQTLTQGGGAALDGVRGDCPRGHGPMAVRPVPGKNFGVEECTTCHGVWLDAGELELLSRGDVAQALRVAAGE